MNRYASEDYAELDSGLPNGSPLSDVRRMTTEIVRVLLLRKWLLFIPFCLGITAALMISQQVQTRYMAKTIFERRDNIVISKLMQQDMPHSFDTLRRGIAYDITRDEAVQTAVDTTDYIKSLPRKEDGALTAIGLAKRNELIGDVNRNIKLKLLEKSNHLDFIEIAYVGFDPVVSADVVNALRDYYIEYTRDRIAGILQNGIAFFEEQINLHRKRESLLDQDRMRFEEGFVGIDLSDPNSFRKELESALGKREALRRDQKEILAKIDMRTNYLESGAPPAIVSETENLELAVLGDRRVAEVIVEIRSINMQIDQLRRNKRMTDFHPSIVPLNKAVVNLEMELQEAKAAARARIENQASEDEKQIMIAAATGTSEDPRILMERTGLQTMLVLNREDLESAEARVTNLESLSATLGNQRKEYLGILQDIESAKGAHKLWENNLAQVMRVQDAEFNNRGIAFNTVEIAVPSARPFSPRWVTVLLFCLATGSLLGAAGVLSAELFDRTFRTSGQVAKVLGIPIISDVAEIISPTEMRRRLLKKVLLQPMVAAALLLLVSFAGLSTYLHIERPEQFTNLMENPSETLMQLLGMS
jgi:uncharacterized protein involved in exopolysaccharide biosynthesis